MRNLIVIRTLKTAIGAAIAMVIAQLLGLDFSSSAGIITILSLQPTKIQSIESAIKRSIAVVIALGIGTLLFTYVGSHPIVFGVYLLVFIPLTVKLGVEEGIVMASVLVTHLMGAVPITGAILLNELGLVVVGVGVALLLNLYMPSVEKQLHQCRHSLEQDMYALFMQMAVDLECDTVSIEEEQIFKRIEQELQLAKKYVYKYNNNYVFAKPSPYEQYFEMRGDQLQVMGYMREHFSRFFMTVEESKVVADFARKVALSIHGKVMAVELLDELAILRQDFKASQLPTTREEFENRAMLYQYLNDIEHFLQIKQTFRESLDPKEYALYQEGYE